MGSSNRIICYEHHNTNVYVKEQLKGKHQDYCLCYQGCARFHPEDKENNCRIANKLYEFDKEFGLVTPIWECPNYETENQDLT